LKKKKKKKKKKKHRQQWHLQEQKGVEPQAESEEKESGVCLRDLPRILSGKEFLKGF